MKFSEFPWGPLIGLAIICAGAFLVYTKIEFVEEEYFSEATDEVRKNPFLAAARLLEESEGFSHFLAEDRRVFSKLDSDDTGVLLLSNVNLLQDKRDAERILEWVKGGGVLLTSPAGSPVFDDSTIPGWFLSQLGLRSTLEYSDSRVKRFDNEQIFEVPIPLDDDQDYIGTPYISSRYYSYFELEDANMDDSTIIDTPHLVHRAFGDGYYTVYSDENLFNNAQISEFDQAYLLLWLSEPAKNKNIMVAHRLKDLPGLISLVWKEFNTAVLILIVALAAFLRWASLRLGPIEQEQIPIKNNLIAHLEARGSFWHRHKQTANVLTQVRQAAIEKLSPHRPHSDTTQTLSEEDRAAIIKLASKELGVTPKQSEHILFADIKSDAAILSTSQSLQKILHKKTNITLAVTE